MSLAPATIAWAVPPARPLVARDRVDVWRLPSGEPALARRATREILARHLGLDAHALLLHVTPTGKPVLDPRHGSDLRFNLAHSGDVALVALRLGHDVGVDVERIRPDVDGAAVAAAVFPPELRLAWHSGLAAGRHEAFFDAWVRFEALAKAGGGGIADPQALRDASRLACRRLPPLAGCAAAVASEGADWSLACWRFESTGSRA